MFHATITLNWLNGDSAKAELRAESAEQNYPVIYSGAVARLGVVPRESDFAFLRFVLNQVAQDTGAVYSEQLDGQYDRQAGGAEGL